MIGKLMSQLKVLSWSLYLVVISLTMSVPALGADPVEAEPAEFQTLDLDHNHALSLGEFLEGTAALERSARTWSFHQQDSNSDSWLSTGEFSSKPPEENPRVVQFRGLDLDHNDSLSRSEYVDSIDQQFREAAGQEFDRFDRNADAQLSFDEFLETPRSATEPANQFARWDRSRDGQLSREEFLARFPEARHLLEKSAFFQRDVDGDGLVSATEFTTPQEQLQPHLKSRYASRDLDDDGKLSCEEYARPHIGGQFEQAAREEAAGADADGDGILSVSEFMFTPHGQVSTEELFSTLDADSNRSLTITEFLAPVEAELHSAKREEFYYHDQDGDLQLSIEELKLPGDKCRPHIRAEYARRDRNSDGGITREEYFTPFIGGQWEKAARDEAVQYDSDGDGNITLTDFALGQIGRLNSQELLDLFDTDQDGQLSRSEFINPRQKSQRMESSIAFLRRDSDGNGLISGGELHREDLTECPDSLAELSDSTVQKFLATWESLDKDQDGKVSRQEWPADHSALLGACGKLPFTEWDLNRDGAVTREECQLVVAASYSLARLDGRPLRQPTGIVANCAYIDAHDINRDHQITLNEFLARSNGAEAAKIFASLDSDGDNILGDQELFIEFRVALDVPRDFARLDTDHDGQLGPDELKSNAHPWQAAMWPRLIPAFDQDQDGRLSFREYRLTPFANPAIEWYQPPLFVDRDSDGQLSWEEFFPQKTAQFINLARHVFDCFDLNDDDSLSIKEFDFAANFSHAPTEVVFESLDRDRNQKLDLTDAVGLVKPTGTDPTAKLRWEERTMEVEDAIRLADKNDDNGVDQSEFQPHQAILTAALNGQPIPQATEAVARSITGATQGNDWNRRTILLVVANILLVGGIGWMVLRPRT